MTTAAEYHATVARARQDYEMAQYIDSTTRMIHEQAVAMERMRNAWITSAAPMPGMKYEGSVEKWRPI